MTYDEALRVLVLKRDADARAVRQAYLREAKLHSPEHDPEGFQRVRAAFELLREPPLFTGVPQAVVEVASESRGAAEVIRLDMAAHAEALQSADEWLQRGQPQTAAEIIQRILDAGRSNPLAPRPNCDAMLQSVLGLFGHGEAVAAATAQRDFEALYLPEERTGNAVLYQATRELAAIHEKLDPSLVRAMAMALCSCQPEQADEALRACALANVSNARAAAALLNGSAPVLFGLFGEPLARDPSDDGRSHQRRREPRVGLIRRLLLSLLLVVYALIHADLVTTYAKIALRALQSAIVGLSHVAGGEP